MNIELLTKNYNQKELAKIANVDQKTISNYINKRTEPTESVLKKLANHFNVSLDFLCDRPFNNNVGFIQEERKETIKELLNMSEDDFSNIVLLINAYKAGKNNENEFNIFNRR